MIYVGTPCGRPNNLLEIQKTIPKSWKWIICYDDRVEIPKGLDATLLKCDYTGPAGVFARNYILEHFPFKDNDWIFQNDDDNIIHPDIEDALSSIEEYEKYAMVAFPQCFHNGDRRLSPTVPPTIGAFDVASYVVQYKYVKGIRYHDIYGHDQLYVLDCYYGGIMTGCNDHDGERGHKDLHAPPPLGIIDKDLSYYNYLDKEDWGHPKYEAYKRGKQEQEVKRNAMGAKRRSKAEVIY